MAEGTQLWERLRTCLISTAAESESGERWRIAAAVCAGNQCGDDRQRADHDRGDPGDPDGS
ncbi:MAG TPA: hypothetical protein VFN72_11330 [Solirubrobacterales bacterium]|nr:hypothetical protein [Solirubrobacterales bacterium]